ncbi:MAG TPA: FxsA family protein [Acidimicrobiales bacterium]|nr:FxsA family protein [Acidimicrobiales bacterium]
MALLLFVIFIVAPIVELAVIVQVAHVLGVFNTIGLLVAVSLVGAWLAKREGTGVLRRIQASLDRGEIPSKEVADGGLILLAGALMIAPGFISDCLAVLLLLPPTRALVRVPLLRFVSRRGRVLIGGGPGMQWRGSYRSNGRTEVWDVESWEEPPRREPRGELEDRP